MGKWGVRLLALASMLLCRSAVTAGETAVPRADGFDPVPVYSIDLPAASPATADEALAQGRVVPGFYPMTRPASRPWRVAFLFPHIKDPYWIGCSYGIVSEARRLGISVDILPAAGYDDLVGQLRKMDEAISAGYDAIVISPISLTANNASIAKARQRGIPVFELANDSTSPDLILKVTTSMKSMGRDATRWVIRDAQRRGMQRIRIALLPGPAGAGWVKGEVEGSYEAARQSPIPVSIVDVKYGDSDRIGQTQLAAQLILQYGKSLDYVIGCTGCIPAVRLPLQEAGLAGKIRLVSFDLTREVAQLIRSGEVHASADTRGVSQARVVTHSVVEYLEGRSVKPPKTRLVRLGLVERDIWRHYRFDTSIAPDGYRPVLSYHPVSGTANP